MIKNAATICINIGFLFQLNLMKTQIGPERVMSLLGGLDESVLENLAEHINIPLKSAQ